MKRRSQDSSVVQHWAMDWMIGGFEFQQGMGIFLFTTVSSSRLAHIHSHPPIDKVKNAWSYTSAPPICLHGVVLN
jgi:hypothetical protein